MAILESLLNGRIATLLGRMAPRWNVRGENRGAFQGSQRQPDILITQTGAQPVVIENEYLPAVTVEVEALDRLGESLDPSVVVVCPCGRRGQVANVPDNISYSL